MSVETLEETPRFTRTDFTVESMPHDGGPLEDALSATIAQATRLARMLPASKRVMLHIGAGSAKIVVDHRADGAC